MNPDEMRRQQQMNDSLYGAPGLKEQGYFRQPGAMGPPTEAMDRQNNPFGRVEDAFKHERKGRDTLWFIDQVNDGGATVMQGDKTMTIPLDLLPKGASEGKYFDPDSGSVVDTPPGPGDDIRKKLVQPDSEFDEMYDMDGG
jgi:hypothetical protein